MKIQLEKKGVFVVQGIRKRRISDGLRVTAFVHPRNEDFQEEPKAFVELSFTHRAGGERTMLVHAGMIASGGQKVTEILANAGYKMPHKRYHRALHDALHAADPKRNKKMILAPGWWGPSFVIRPAEILSPSGTTSVDIALYPSPTVKLGQFHKKGTLAEWRQNIGVLGTCSSRARLMLGVSLAALILKLVDHSSFAINIVGESSIGKTLLLRIAASVAGLVQRGGVITSLDETPSSLEQLLIGHRDNFLPLDEIGHLEGQPRRVAGFLKALSFRQTSGRTKGRAGQYEAAVQLVRTNCRNIVGMTSERSIAEINADAGARRLAGEEVRLIELPATHGGNDIFDKKNARKFVGRPGAQRQARIAKLEQNVWRFQGTAARAFLQNVIDDKGAKKKLNNQIGIFLESVEAVLESTSDRRLARSIALVDAAIELAIEYGVLKWSVRKTRDDLARCLIDALAFRRRSVNAFDGRSGDGFIKDLHSALISDDFKLLSLDKRRWTEVTNEELSHYDAFGKIVGDSTTPTIYIKATWLKARFGDKRARLCRLAIEKGIMLPGRARNISTYQQRIGHRKVEVYRIDQKMLDPFLEWGAT